MRNTLKNHLHHIIFVVSILSLTALLGWWYIFLQQSISNQRMLKEQNLFLNMDLIAEKYQNDGHASDKSRIPENDPRFEILDGELPVPPESRAITRGAEIKIIRVRPEVLAAHQKEFARKKLMLIGESSLLVVIVLLGFIFLYNYVRLEKLTRREVKKFWERVTHELKTPMTSVKAFIESITPQNLSHPKFWDLRNQALALVSEQEAQIERILNISNIEPNLKHLECRSINLNNWLNEYVANPVADLHRIKIEFRAEYENIHIKANPSGLKIILDNIIDNAIKYCPKPVSLVFTIGIDKRNIHLIITDNGPGVNAQMMKKLFQPGKFLQDESSPVSHGSGMGLPISRDIARKMGGDLKARNRPDGFGLELRLSFQMN